MVGSIAHTKYKRTLESLADGQSTTILADSEILESSPLALLSNFWSHRLEFGEGLQAALTDRRQILESDWIVGLIEAGFADFGLVCESFLDPGKRLIISKFCLLLL